MSEFALHQNLRAGYGDGGGIARACHCACPKARCWRFLGRNGTGKTTLINSIVGVTRRFGGTLSLGGVDITAMRAGPAGAGRHRLGAAGTQHFRSLTVEET